MSNTCHSNLILFIMSSAASYLYLIDYWVPFPDSEYGGIITLIAKDDNEAYELCVNEEGFPNGYNDLIMPKIQRAQSLPLAVDYQSTILEAFIT